MTKQPTHEWDRYTADAQQSIYTWASNDPRTHRVGVKVGTLVGTTVGADEGREEGMKVGVELGTLVGTLVGTAEGTDEGADVGRTLGAGDGTEVGMALGVAVGLAVGTAVGPTVGKLLGAGVGRVVGMFVGVRVGATEGLEVGTTVGPVRKQTKAGRARIFVRLTMQGNMRVLVVANEVQRADNMYSPRKNLREEGAEVGSTVGTDVGILDGAVTRKKRWTGQKNQERWVRLKHVSCTQKHKCIHTHMPTSDDGANQCALLVSVCASVQQVEGPFHCYQPCEAKWKMKGLHAQCQTPVPQERLT